MSKNMIHIIRKCFYVFDMVLLGILLLSFEHTLLRENPVIDSMLDAALLLRVAIPFLLYRHERMAAWPILAFTTLFGVVVYAGILRSTIMNMGCFPSVVMDSEPTMGDLVVPRETTWAVVMRGIIYWVWLMPMAAFAIQLTCRQTVRNGYPWYYFIGGIVFRDRVGKTFLRMAVMLAIAYLIGYEMQERLSFLAMSSLPLVAYHYWNKHLDRSPHWIEYAVFFMGLYVFSQTQYHFDTERVMFLSVSAVMILAVCCWMAYRTKCVLIPMLAFATAGLLLPSVSLGYNVYQGIEGARMTNYVHAGTGNSKGYMYIQRTEVVNGKEIRLVGVRDRYHTTIPCAYSYVLPTGLYSPFAKCVKEGHHAVVRSVEKGYILE